MMALIQISEKEIDTLHEWNNAGKAAEVWRYLGNKGDAYAFLATAVVSGDADAMLIPINPLQWSMSDDMPKMFYQMVKSQWRNVDTPLLPPAHPAPRVGSRVGAHVARARLSCAPTAHFEAV